MTTPAELRTQIELKGAEISVLAEQIEQRLEELKDWRNNIEYAPLRTVALSVGAGLMASGIAIPVIRSVGRQVGTAARASLTAYLTALFTDKLFQLAGRPR
ncbi:MAG TPA: hypothetical protein V6C99_04855 [Oculatellaceae cyanobacterium]